MHHQQSREKNDRENLCLNHEKLASLHVPPVLLLHPRTRNQAEELGFSLPHNAHIVEQVSYLEMVWLEMNCLFVLTGYGLVQKEAFFHRKPCITPRYEAEWV